MYVALYISVLCMHQTEFYLFILILFGSAKHFDSVGKNMKQAQTEPAEKNLY